MAVVGPARMVRYRIKACSDDRYTRFNGGTGLFGYVVQPGRPFVVFDPRFGDHDRTAVLRVVLAQYLVQRPVELMSERYFSTARVPPLIVEIVVQANDVDVSRIASQLGVLSSRKHIECLKLCSPIILGSPFRGRGAAS